MSSPPEVRLYSFPLSFCAQRVCITLAERNIPHKTTHLNFVTYEQLEPWYIRINPLGKVPVLKVGEEIHTDSEHIVEVVDKLDSTENVQLLPDVTTELGKSVARWRTKLTAVPVEIISYGVAMNKCSLTGLPYLMQRAFGSTEKYIAQVKDKIRKLEQGKRGNPDLVETIDNIIAQKQKQTNGYSLQQVNDSLDGLDKLMDEVEQQLRKMKKEHDLEYWLCGPTFTLADINLCILLARLDFLGMLIRYTAPENRPLLCEYWAKAKERPSVKSYALGASGRTKRLVISRKLVAISKPVIVMGGLAVVAGLLIQKFIMTV